MYYDISMTFYTPFFSRISQRALNFLKQTVLEVWKCPKTVLLSTTFNTFHLVKNNCTDSSTLSRKHADWQSSHTLCSKHSTSQWHRPVRHREISNIQQLWRILSQGERRTAALDRIGDASHCRRTVQMDRRENLRENTQMDFELENQEVGRIIFWHKIN